MSRRVDIKIVAIGGGTGQSTLLRGLKEITKDITAVVTVADDGGGSGILRREYNMLPPGDIRNCILALATKEPILQDLFNYRFTEGGLKGQSFGNLMIAAMNGISTSFEDAVKKVADIFAITGRVLPVSLDDISLHVKLKNGEIISGESNIPLSGTSPIENIWISPSNAQAFDEVILEIEKADAIVICAGSLFTSIIPNLLVEGICQSINNSKARIFVVANLMSQRGETSELSHSQHLQALFKHTGLKRVDHWLVSEETIPEAILERYKKEGSYQLKLNRLDLEFAQSLSIDVSVGAFADLSNGLIRHNSRVIAKLIGAIIEKHHFKIYNKNIR